MKLKIKKPFFIDLFGKDGELDLPDYKRQEVEFEFIKHKNGTEFFSNKNKIEFPVCTTGSSVVEGGYIIDAEGDVLYSFDLEPKVYIEPMAKGVEFAKGGLTIIEDIDI